MCSGGAGPVTKPSDAKLDCGADVLCDYTEKKDDEAEPTDLQVRISFLFKWSIIYTTHDSHPYHLFASHRFYSSNINTRTPTLEHRYEWRMSGR